MVRYKNRYLLLEWKFSNLEVGYRALKGETSRNLQSFLKEQVQAYHGDYGVACVLHALTVKYHNVSTLVMIVRCPRAHYRAVWSALSGVTSYKSEPCTLSVLHVAGTIRSSQRNLLQHNTAALRRATEKKQGLQEALRNV